MSLRVHRVVANPVPGVSFLLELADDATDLDELLSIRGLTDPIARDAQTMLRIVPAEDWYHGPLAASAMAPFMHRASSRFSAGIYGVLYAAETLEIAWRESAYHAARVAAAARMFAQPIGRVAFRLRLSMDRMADIRAGAPDDPKDPAIYNADPDAYAAAQRLGKRLRDAGKWTVRYTSVRHSPGSCFGVFVPRAIEHVEDQGKSLRLLWDGTRITAVEVVETILLSGRT